MEKFGNEIIGGVQPNPLPPLPNRLPAVVPFNLKNAPSIAPSKESVKAQEEALELEVKRLEKRYWSNV